VDIASPKLLVDDHDLYGSSCSLINEVPDSGIARPGEKGNKDGYSRAEVFRVSCDADQRGFVPLLFFF
jgi:hypothetical protein